ncbi:hypothetical protein N0V90_005123 [Kalmusia sp. IMI 367209]|nr:hypothetical protein N0V90_005123 [Kalmusia sp. IMI 367209]
MSTASKSPDIAKAVELGWQADDIAAKYARGEAATRPYASIFLDKASIADISSDIHALDIGCGTGSVVAELYGKVPKEKWGKVSVLGGDISESMLKYLKERGEKEGWTGLKVDKVDGANIQLPSSSFTHIFANAIIFFLPLTVLKTCFDLLQPDGFIGMTTWAALPWYGMVEKAVSNLPNPPTLPPLSELRDRLQQNRPWHEASYVRSQLVEAGFKNVEVIQESKKVASGWWDESEREKLLKGALEELHKEATKEAATNPSPKGLDSSSKPPPIRPVVARMYDWYLGGTHNYEIDRQAGADIVKVFPPIKATAIENRIFLRRAVRWLAKNGLTQFIDMGSGLPTAGSTHETILKVDPNARILYVDIEESAVEEGNAYIRETGCENQVGMIRASALEPEAVSAHPETQRLIDFSKPVAIMMFALIHFWTPAQYTPVLDYWKTKVVKGSAFVMTHCTEEGRNAEELEELRRLQEVYARTPTPIMFRTKEELATVMEGWDLVEPGIVRPHLWKEGEGQEEEQESPLTRVWWVGVGFMR